MYLAAWKHFVCEFLHELKIIMLTNVLPNLKNINFCEILMYPCQWIASKRLYSLVLYLLTCTFVLNEADTICHCSCTHTSSAITYEYLIVMKLLLLQYTRFCLYLYDIRRSPIHMLLIKSLISSKPYGSNLSQKFFMREDSAH